MRCFDLTKLYKVDSSISKNWILRPKKSTKHFDEIFNDLFPLQLKELYVLLTENYVEDDDNMFRFDYSPEFLRWALMPPEYLKEWHTGTAYILGQ